MFLPRRFHFWLRFFKRRDAQPMGDQAGSGKAQERGELEELDRQLASIARQSHEFIGIADLEGRARFLNEFGRLLIGMAPDEPVGGRTVFDFVHPSDHKRLASEVMPALVASGRWSGELTFRRFSDGAAIPMLHEGFRIDAGNGRPLCIATASRDLTELKRANRELRQLEQAFLEETDRQQQRLGRELHDGLGQALTGLSLLLAALARQAARGEPIGADAFAKAEDLARNAVRTAGDIARGLSPLSENAGELIKSIRQLVERAGSAKSPVVKIRVNEGAPVKLSAEARNHVFRIVQEALSNALRHSGATTIEVQVDVDAVRFHLAVTDNGTGFAGRSTTNGLGLRTMRYRALSIGGTLDVRRGSASGCVVECVVPQAMHESSLNQAL